MIIKNKINQILILTISDIKKLNALNSTDIKKLIKILSNYRKNKNVKGVILTGDGDKSFIAGADIASMSKMTPKEAFKYSKLGQELTLALENYNKPVLCAINGYAYGGGCEVALACHFRLGSKKSSYSQPEVKLGLIAGWGATYRLPKLIGQSKAMKMLLSGEILDAVKAKEIGLIDDVFESKELINESIKFLNNIIQNSPVAISNTIKSINSDKNQVKNFLKNERKLFEKTFSSLDCKEGIDAFLNKRKPKFKGK